MILLSATNYQVIIIILFLIIIITSLINLLKWLKDTPKNFIMVFGLLICVIIFAILITLNLMAQ